VASWSVLKIAWVRTVASTYWLLGACAFTSMASMRVCDSLLPALATEFSTGLGPAAATISVFAFAYGVLQLFYGPLGDRYGKLNVIAIATLFCTVGNAAAALAADLDWLIASRVVSGAGAAGVIPLSMAWIGDTVAYEDRQAVLVKLLAATVFGMIGGQWLGGVIAEWVGWRVAFGVLAVLFLAHGAFLLIRARASEAPAGGVVFPRHARSVAGVLAQPWPRRILATTLLEGAFAFSALAFIPLYMQARLGLSMSAAGAIAALYGVGGLLYSTVARGLLRRLGEQGLARLGGTTIALGLFALALASHWSIAAPACLAAGFGFYALHNTLQVTATEMSPAMRGTAMSLFACSLFLGQSIGISIAAVVAERLSPAAVFAGCAFALLMIGGAFSRQLRLRAASQDAPRPSHRT